MDEEGEEEARRSREGWEHTAAVSSPGLSLQAAREAPPGEMKQLQVPGEKPPSPASPAAEGGGQADQEPSMG